MTNEPTKGIHRFIFLITIFCITSCARQGKIIPLNEMKVVVWDMMCADAWYTKTLEKDSTAKKNHLDMQRYEEVFSAHHVSRQDVVKTYKYYKEDLSNLQILIDSAQAYGNRQAAKVLRSHCQKK
jgi:hypothetical protein